MSVTELEEYRAVLERTVNPVPAYRPAQTVVQTRLRPDDRGSYEKVTRAIDVVGALVGIALTFPVMGLVAAAVKLTSRGPAVFHQLRVGQDGQLFRCYKFRTMVVDAEQVLDRNPELKAEFLKRHKLDRDPRITPIGKFLRKTSLDELPQFFNVLIGDMTLVGPRPIVPPELVKYGDYADRLIEVKPGLTGLWQVSGRSETTYEERVMLDMEYIENRSVIGNLKLIFKTVFVTLARKGAV